MLRREGLYSSLISESADTEPGRSPDRPGGRPARAEDRDQGGLPGRRSGAGHLAPAPPGQAAGAEALSAVLSAVRAREALTWYTGWDLAALQQIEDPLLELWAHGTGMRNDLYDALLSKTTQP